MEREAGAPLLALPRSLEGHRKFLVQGVEAGMWEESGGWPRRPSPVTVAK